MNKLSNTLFTFIILIGAKGYSKEGLISENVLKENKIDPTIVHYLLSKNVLIKTNETGYYELNERKVFKILKKNSSPELIEFMLWLKSIVGEETQINEKEPGLMTPSAQDFKV